MPSATAHPLSACSPDSRPTSANTAPADPPPSPTAEGCARGGTSSASYPAGRSRPSTTGSASTRTRCGPPPRQDTPTPAAPDHDHVATREPLAPDRGATGGPQEVPRRSAGTPVGG